MTAPIAPPRSAGIVSSIIQRGTVASSRRNPTAPASDPGQSATAFVAFAITGSTPTHIKAGNESNVPPPAMELMVPATKAAMQMIVNFIGGDQWTPVISDL